jgi:hypothetical protein
MTANNLKQDVCDYYIEASADNAVSELQPFSQDAGQPFYKQPLFSK